MPWMLCFRRYIKKKQALKGLPVLYNMVFYHATGSCSATEERSIVRTISAIPAAS